MSGHHMPGKDRRQYFVSHVTTSHKVRHLQGVIVISFYLLRLRKLLFEIHSKLATILVLFFFPPRVLTLRITSRRQ